VFSRGHSITRFEFKSEDELAKTCELRDGVCALKKGRDGSWVVEVGERDGVDTMQVFWED
jgi:hypothetical protein